MASFQAFINRLVNCTSGLSWPEAWRGRLREQRRHHQRPANESGYDDWDDNSLPWSYRTPPPRTRELTPPGSPNASQHTPISPQLGSLLFSLLPAEVRMQVWEWAVGNNIVHILLQDERAMNLRSKGRPVPVRLSHVECYCEEAEDWWRHECIVQAWDSPCPYVGRTRHGLRADSGKIGLLLSCRRAYTEAISLLYTTNTFDLNDSGGHTHFPLVLDFAASILPRRLAAIRHLQFRYFYHHHHANNNVGHEDDGQQQQEETNNSSSSLEKWLAIVAVLKEDMTGLETLNLEISTEKPAMRLGGGHDEVGGAAASGGGVGAVAMTATSTSRVDEREILGSLAEIVHVRKSFVVDVNWVGHGEHEGGQVEHTQHTVESEEEASIEWPFVLRRLTHR